MYRNYTIFSKNYKNSHKRITLKYASLSFNNIIVINFPANLSVRTSVYEHGQRVVYTVKAVPSVESEYLNNYFFFGLRRTLFFKCESMEK